ncbi:MAG: fructose-1,6-bisphosphatase [Bacteroidaceae bacterium]|nr:fructose-1,6-bisphosphatase [Bacteroidaceae bacterium]
MKNAKETMKYLKLLAKDFPNVSKVTQEIINLEAIMHLPKSTEHFLADLHGESEAFQHVIRNASGYIKRKVHEIFDGTLSESEINDLCTLIYYPEKKLELVLASGVNLSDFYQSTLNRLISVCRIVSSKYSRSKVRKSLPKEFEYIIEELLHESTDRHNKQAYYNVIIQTIIGTKRADKFVIQLCYLIQRLAIDHLHILGDIFDRGSGAHLIMDTLCNYHNLDIEWGNHDILWMGAAAGNPVCASTVIRLSLRYANTATLEEGYGITMVKLAAFAMETYADDPCDIFKPFIDLSDENGLIPGEKTQRLIAQMHKAIAVIQFKLEGQIYKKHPEWGMLDRCLLEHIRPDEGIFVLDGVRYPMTDNFFPTIDPADPYKLTADEEEIIQSIVRSFCSSERLQRHMKCLLAHGGMYVVCNSNLLFHASIPLNEDGSLREVDVLGVKYKGRELMTRIEEMVRLAYEESADDDEKAYAKDYFWYLWCGPNSPLFGKSKMTTFERYFLTDKQLHKEEKGWYYKLRNEANVCEQLLDNFEVLGRHRHIINGHVPVKVGKGENPIKADGRLMVIDGGFSKAYHSTTGIAGYTLVYHSRGFQLVQHAPFNSTEEAVQQGTDIHSTTSIVEITDRRMLVADTDIGRALRQQVNDLERLLSAYRKGWLKETI